MNIEFKSLISQIQKALEPITRLNERVNEFIQDNPDFLNNLQDYLKNWPQYHKDSWVKLAEFGWYLNWYTPITIETVLTKDQNTLNGFMADHLNSEWDEITSKILTFYPERKHILETAFRLHQDKNYIACIPLFFSQIDGICAQVIGAFLFSEHERRQAEIQNIIAESDSVLSDVFLEVLNSETQFGASISKASSAKKALAPNRNGILHGSRKHLDYGSEINSLKAFSLLAFIVFCFDKNKDNL